MRHEDNPSWIPRHLYPFDDRFVEIDGSRIHYIDEGSGPTLLFLHGNPTWSFLYRDVIVRLRDSFRCIALDYPGFGLSSAPPDFSFTPAAHSDVVERFVLQLDLNAVTLMGQDWGGPIGLSTATRHPQRFAGFVLGNTWAWPLNGIFHFEVAARIMGSLPARFWIRRTNAFVNVMLPLGTASELSDDVMRAYRGPFETVSARKPTWRFPKELLASKPFMTQLARDLDRISHLPTLFIWGGGDFALRKDVELPRFERLLPNHETIVLERARHFFQEDAPDRVADAIRSWMNGRANAEATPRPGIPALRG